jgi:hypothetical protein
MDDPDKLLKHRREGGPSGLNPIIDSYEFDPRARNGRIRKVVVVHQPGHGYRTIVFIDGNEPIERAYHDGRWEMAKDDVRKTLEEYQCEVFSINDPSRS